MIMQSRETEGKILSTIGREGEILIERTDREKDITHNRQTEGKILSTIGRQKD